jgi:hypothetical protein
MRYMVSRNDASRLANALLFASLSAFAASLCLVDIASWDYWWQLRTGQLIVDAGSIPRQDPYSFTAPGARYVDIHWLFQLMLYGLYRVGGHAGVVFAKLGFILALLALLVPIGLRRDRAWLTAVGLAIMLMLCADRILPRPELPSFVLLGAVLLMLDRFRRRPDAWVYSIVCIQLVWTNMHGLFALGIAVCAMELAGELLDRWSEGRQPGGRARRLAAVTGLSILVAPVNPNGLQGALYPLMQLDMIGSVDARRLGATTVELQPSLGALSPFALWLAGTLVLFSFGALAYNWRRLRFADLLMWFAFLYLALAASRNLALFAIVAVPIAVRNANAALDARRPHPSGQRGGAVLASVTASLVLLLFTADAASGRFYRRLGLVNEPGIGTMQSYFSIGAVDWIHEHRPKGPFAHNMADGALMIFFLYPSYRVMVDGRLEVYGAELLEQLRLEAPEDVQRLDARYELGGVLVHHSKYESDRLLAWLSASPHWSLVFVDAVSTLYLRSEQLADGRIHEIDVNDPDLFPGVDDRGRVQTELRARGQALFYQALGRTARARDVIEQARALYPDILRD